MKNVFKILETLAKVLPLVSQILELFKKPACDNEHSENTSKSSE